MTSPSRHAVSRRSFVGLLGLGLALVTARQLHETLPLAARQPLHPVMLARRYAQVFSTPGFVLLTLAGGLGFNAYFLYVLSAPVFLIQHLGLPETGFGWFFIPTVLAMMAGSGLALCFSCQSSRMVLMTIMLPALVTERTQLLNMRIKRSCRSASAFSTVA